MSSRRIRQHVNPMRSTLLRIALPELNIPEDAPVEVELGSAEAHFLMERAAAAPHGRYVGLELRQEMVRKANTACRKAGLHQVSSVYANMLVDLPRLFSPGRVTRFFLYFPDPWFKSRQKKRRVAGTALVSELMGVLSPSGEIYMATDIFDLALDSMAALEAEPRLENLAGEWRFLKENPFAARSRRERQCEGDGSHIWRLGYRCR